MVIICLIHFQIFLHLHFASYSYIQGRIHQAVVTQLHVASNSVSVEWCERNETKGKEIELEALHALNSTLVVNINQAMT